MTVLLATRSLKTHFLLKVDSSTYIDQQRNRIMTSAYIGRNTPQRQSVISFSLEIAIDKTLAGSDKIRLPESVINTIMREYPRNPPNPVIFEIQSMMVVKGKPQLHCGVLEFTAPKDTALIPFWMTNCLQDSKGKRVIDGSKMRFVLRRSLEALKFAKFKPMDRRFARDIQTPRATLEHALRKYTVLTEGQRLPIIHNGKVYPLLVESVNPSPAGHLIDTNLQVEFSAPDKNANYKNNDTEMKSDEKDNGNNKNNNENDNDNDSDYGDEAQTLSLYTPVNETISENKNVRGLYYKIKIANPNYPIRCVLTIKKGDANIYAHSSFDKPNITRFLWCNENESNEKEIYISNKDKEYKKWIYVGIQLFNCQFVEFEFFVDQERDAKKEEKDDDSDDKEKANQSGNQLGSSENSANSQKCDNCGKMISNGAFMMHSVQCARINWKCPQCNKVISKAMKDKHIHCDNCNEIFETESSKKRHFLLRHSKIPCDLCKEKFYANEMIGHQKHECLMRSVPCKWCGMKLEFLQLKEHETFCGSLTVECELCGQTVQRRRLENHLASEHDLNPTLETRRVNQILHSNLGLDQTVNWEEREINKLSPNANNMKPQKSLDDDDNNNNHNSKFLDPDDADPTIRSLKKQFSQFHSFEEEQTAAQGNNNEIERNDSRMSIDDDDDNDNNNNSNDNNNGNNKKNGDDVSDDGLFDDEQEEEQVHDFLCPYCQKHPPLSIPFGDHLVECGQKSMHDDD